MKNSELLKISNDAYLSSIDKQRRFILRTLIEPKGCPNCAAEVNYFDGAKIKLDELDLHKSVDPSCSCPACKRGLEYIVPLMGENWRWRLVPISGG